MKLGEKRDIEPRDHWKFYKREDEKERLEMEQEECDHQYAEQGVAPLGVRCIKCGHFVGAWET